MNATLLLISLDFKGNERKLKPPFSLGPVESVSIPTQVL